jgi:hypothetical protein
MPNWKKVIVSGSSATLNSLFVSTSVTASIFSGSAFTGSLFGTASWANNATTSSFATNAGSASYALNAGNAQSASFTSTASSADNFTVRGTLTAQTIVVQVITSSTDFVTGSTRFGTLASNTHQFTGSVSISGSLTVQGAISGSNITGSLLGTASYANNALSSSYAVNSGNTISASFSTNAGSSSYALNAGNTISASFATNAGSASYALNAGNSITASFATNANSASYALNAGNAQSASFATNAANAFIQNGNSFGAQAVLGTNDAQNLAFETNGTVRMTITGSDGNVGIGTISPVGRLQIGGTSGNLLTVGTLTNTWGGDIAMGVTNGNGVIISKINAANDTNRVIVFSRDDTNGATIWGYTPGGGSSDIGFLLRASASSYFNGGNVGIGITAPDAKLTVSASSGDLATFYTGTTKRLTITTGGNLSFNTNTSLGLIWSPASLLFEGQNQGITARPYAANYVSFTVAGAVSQTANLQTWQAQGGTVYSVVDAAGNFAIQATASIGKLQLGSFWTANPGSTNTIFLASSGFANTNIAPEAIITSNNSSTSSGGVIGLALHNSNTTAGAFSPLLVFSKTETGSSAYNASIAAIGARTVTGTGAGDAWIDGDLMFYTAPTTGGGLVERMRIIQDGNVGIGTTSPSAKLDVSGSTVITGSLTVITGSNIEFQVLNTGVRIGNLITDVHTVTGSLGISGSVTATNFTGSLFGTASWANNVVSSSYALNAGNAQTASFAITASFALNGGGGPSGPSSGAAYTHTQASTSSTWTVDHNLNNSYPVVTVYDFNGFVVVPLNISSSNVNRTTITFSYAATGYATAVAAGISNIVSASFATNAGNAQTASFFSGTVTSASYASASTSASFATQAANATSASFATNAANAFIQNGNSFGAQAVLGTNDAQNLAFETNGTVRMTITGSDGNVGINTTTPAYRLDVVGNVRLTNSAAQLIIDNATHSELNYGASNYFRANGGSATIVGPIISLFNGASEVLRVTGSNVGIGTITPSAKLDVNGNAIITGSLTVITGSNIEFQVLNTGVRIGNLITDVHTVTGSLGISGSVTATNFTGSLFGTASFATNATSASYASSSTSASYASSSTSASFATNAVTAQTASFFSGTVTSASYALNAGNAQTASFATNANSASYALNAGNSITASFATNANSASYALNAGNTISSSFATNANSASYALNAGNTQTASFATNANSASYALNAGNTQTASFATNANSASYALNAGNTQTASFATTARSASYATNAGTTISSSFSTNAGSSSYALNAGNAITASFALNGGGGGGTPGGSNTQIQYNNASTFGGVPVLTYDGTTLRATGSFTGSLTGALTGTASFAQTASFFGGSISTAVSASYASASTSASFATNAQTASFALNGNSNFLHTQSIAATTWSVNHNFQTQFPVVTVYDSTNSVIIPQQISASSTSSLTILFATARTGWVAVSKGGYAATVGNTVTVTSASYAATASYAEGFNISLSQYSATSSAISGSSRIIAIPTASYNAVFVDYVVSSGSNQRAGTFIGTWNINNVQFTDNSTLDIGSTTPVTMSVAISGSRAVVQTQSPAGWTIKTTYRTI